MAGQQWVCSTADINSYNFTKLQHSCLKPYTPASYQVINLISVWCVREQKRDNGRWTAVSMCPLHLSPGKSPFQGQQSSPTIFGIAGGNEAGWVNIYVRLIDKGPLTGVVCVWFPSCMDEQINEIIHNCTHCYCQGVLRISHNLHSSDRQSPQHQNRHFAPLGTEVIHCDSDPPQQSLSLELWSCYNVWPVSVRRNDLFRQTWHWSQKGQRLWGKAQWDSGGVWERSGDILLL